MTGTSGGDLTLFAVILTPKSLEAPNTVPCSDVANVERWDR
jgi:hypothetical protein